MCRGLGEYRRYDEDEWVDDTNGGYIVVGGGRTLLGIMKENFMPW